MSKNERILLGVSCFLGGVVAGFLIAPIKEGIYCGNNNGNYIGSKEDSDDSLNNTTDKLESDNNGQDNNKQDDSKDIIEKVII